MPPRDGGSAVSEVRLALSNFDNVTIRIAHVTACLAVLFLWFSEKLGSSASPEFIACLNIGDAYIHKAADIIEVGRDAERHRRFIGRGATAEVHNEPHVRDLDESRRALVIAYGQNAAAKDLFVESSRPFDVGDGDKARYGDSVPGGHLVGFLSDLDLAHGLLQSG